MSASPDTDRSLNADQPVTEPEKSAAVTESEVKISPISHPAMTIDTSSISPSTKTGNTTPSPDLSSLSREELEARLKTLTESLASANNEAEFFRQQWQDLRLRDEALGMEVLTGDEQKLNDKLVQAVAELYRSEMKRREALQLLDKLLGTTGELLTTAPNYDPKVRADYEVASRAAKDYLAGHSGAAIPLGSTLSDGRISDINPQLNEVVLNIGKNQGVKEGMHFLIYQDNQQVGTVMIELARDLVSGAQVLNLAPKVALKVGDRAVVDNGQ